MGSFSQIMPLNTSGNEVCGYISALNEEFYIHLTKQMKGTNLKIQLKGCKKFHHTLEPLLADVKKHLNQCNSLNDMLLEIQTALEHQIRLMGGNQCINHITEYSVLFEQLQNCGWDKVHFISSDFSELHLKWMDDFDREHILKIWVSEKFPIENPKYECDLPQEFNYRWFPDDTLLNMFNVFQDTSKSFTEFWNNMDEIDTNTWVLEPEKPWRKDCKRRIALAPGISLLLVINPVAPTSIPTCHYLGPEKVVETFREKFNRNIHRWSEYETVLTNLRQVLDMDFPSPMTTEKDEFCVECGICYSYLLDDNIPNLTCENPSCNQAFHHACLYECIRMLPDVRTSFNKLFGQCPYCSKPLWCTIP